MINHNKHSEYLGREADVQMAKQLAKSHWRFISKWFGMLYHDAMVHGYVHGIEDGRKEKRNDTP